MENQKLFAACKSLDEARNILTKELRRIDWQHLAANGFEVDALFVYRDKHDSTLAEARTVVKEFIAAL